MTSLIEQLTSLQAAVYQAAEAIVEVETRDLGWRAREASAAQKRYAEAIEAYKSAFGIEPEMESKHVPGMHGNFPLANPTQQRIIAVCGSAVL